MQFNEVAFTFNGTIAYIILPCRESNAGPRPQSERKVDTLDSWAMDPLYLMVVYIISVIFNEHAAQNGNTCVTSC